MLRKIFYIIFIFSLAGMTLNAQTQTVVLKGKITDLNKKPIPFAGIQNVSFFTGVTADEKGNYIFKTKIPATIKVSALGFVAQRTVIDFSPGRDTIELNFVLQAESIQLQSVDISAIHKPEEITEADNLTDFELKDNLLWLLYEMKTGNKVVITDTSGKQINQFNLKFQAEQLSKTNHNYVYAMSDDSAFVFENKNEDFNYFTMPKPVFIAQALSIVAYDDWVYYYEKKDSIDAMLSYSYYDKKNGVQKTLYSYFNGEKGDANKEISSEITFLENGGILPVPVGGLRFAGDQIVVLHNMVQPVVCELKIIRDSVYVFNFDNDSIYVYDHSNKYSRRMSLSFDVYGVQYKKKEILVDEEKQECYFEYSLNGIVCIEHIDLNTGRKLNTETLSQFPFLEKVRISHGEAYFCYYDRFSNSQKRKIYRQQLD